MVAEIGGLDLSGHPDLRIGCWKGAESSERVAENFPVILWKCRKAGTRQT
jgi:hypothetical protein